MEILIDVRSVNDQFPGVGRYVYHLVRELARIKERPPLLLLSNAVSADTRFDRQSLASKPGVRTVYTAARPFSAREQVFLPFELRSLSPALLHFPYLVLPFAAPGPKVLTLHDLIPVRLPRYFSLRQRILYRMSLFLALHTARAVICVSEATRRDLISLFKLDTSKISVIHEGVAESFRPRGEDEIRSVRSAYGLPEEYLLYVGSNKPHKNLPLLMDACARLRGAPPLVLAGVEDARYRQARDRAAALQLKGRIRFEGRIRESDLPALYSGARGFVFPSLYEGFGLPPLEAMACGAPVACSDIPSLRETVGDAALLFDPNDPASIAEAIERLLGDKDTRATLKARGFQRASELNWTLAAQKTLEVYGKSC